MPAAASGPPPGLHDDARAPGGEPGAAPGRCARAGPPARPPRARARPGAPRRRRCLRAEPSPAGGTAGSQPAGRGERRPTTASGRRRGRGAPWRGAPGRGRGRARSERPAAAMQGRSRARRGGGSGPDQGREGEIVPARGRPWAGDQLRRSGRPLESLRLPVTSMIRSISAPDPAQAEGDQLEDPEARVAEVEPVDPEGAEEERDQDGDQPVLVREDAGHLARGEPGADPVRPADHRGRPDHPGASPAPGGPRRCRDPPRSPCAGP